MNFTFSFDLLLLSSIEIGGWGGAQNGNDLRKFYQNHSLSKQFPEMSHQNKQPKEKKNARCINQVKNGLMQTWLFQTSAPGIR